jgi:hypothetical protein
LTKSCSKFLAVGFLVLATGCRILPTLPPADLSGPGWTIREGQAVWRLPAGKGEIAGEILVASQADGRAVVQFTKTPFTLVLAQATPERWETAFPTQERRYAGRGAPPRRLLWLHLPHVLAGGPLPQGWQWHEDEHGWRLEHPGSGESLDGYFSR